MMNRYKLQYEVEVSMDKVSSKNQIFINAESAESAESMLIDKLNKQGSVDVLSISVEDENGYRELVRVLDTESYETNWWWEEKSA